jgi:alpha-L-fucosidase
MRSLRTSLVLAVGLLCACSSNGTGDNNPSGVGGAGALGGQTGSGGNTGNASALSSGGAKTGVGGATSTGGKSSAGGAATNSGGALTSGGANGSGGANSAGAATGMGGATGTGGKSGAGGASTGSGGTVVGGGSNSSGGRSAAGGESSSGGLGGRSATGGVSGVGGAGGSLGTGGQPACGPTGTPDIWNLPKFTVATGPYTADWQKLGLAYSTPQWWRDAKFGAWAHWDPQSMPEQGDWYAYHMYQQNSADFNYQVSHYGDPGGANAYGYKDICHAWVIDQWDPNALMDLYVQMGAKFFMAMGSHHDNFDCWDSSYQPWNSVKVGVKKDLVGTWEPIARQKGLRFGIGFHNTPARTWGQWMPIRYASDSVGPYDAMQTTADGTGKWWQGMNPADLYGAKHSGDCSNNSCNTSSYGTQFMYRVDEAICKYHPDVVYFDDHAGDSQTDLGVHMGLGSIAPTILANYYNKSLAWSEGKVDVVMNMKGVGGQYDSFQNNEALLPYVQRALVRSTEAATETAISAYPFQTELDIQGGNWHYMTGAGYTSASSLVTTLMQNVSRNGSLLLNLTQHGRGNLDTQCTQIAKDIGAWLQVNGEAVYASRPFEVWGDTTVLYTRNNGNVYATLLNWNGGAVTLSALKSGGATLGTVSKVELLGSTVALTFSQSGQGLTVTPGGSVSALTGITDSQLASKMRVLRITHSKGWFNDDDSGAAAPGWLRKVALGTGDYNNDLTTSTTTGDTWTSTFTGTSVSVYAPKESGDGKIEIQIDGQTSATADLSATGARQAQQLVAQVTGLAAGQHTISIINRGPGPVAVDAIVVQ